MQHIASLIQNIPRIYRTKLENKMWGGGDPDKQQRPVYPKFCWRSDDHRIKWERYGLHNKKLKEYNKTGLEINFTKTEYLTTGSEIRNLRKTDLST